MAMQINEMAALVAASTTAGLRGAETRATPRPTSTPTGAASTALDRALDRARQLVEGWCESEGLEAETEFVGAAASYVAYHNRGICLLGASGTGKTTLASVLSRHCGKWPVLRARELQRRVSQLSREMGDEKGFLAAVNAARIDFAGRYDYDLCVDDLGKEARTALSYGNATDIVAEAMEERYDMWREGRGVTLLTTELTYSQLREIYPAHVINRIEEMCVPVVLRVVRRGRWQA